VPEDAEEELVQLEEGEEAGGRAVPLCRTRVGRA
jgi:hypothetical protein